MSLKQTENQTDMDRDSEGKQTGSLPEELFLCQEELRANGWQFDLADADQPLRRYDAESGTMGERASPSNVVENSDEYIHLKALVHKYTTDFMVGVVGLESAALPLEKDFIPKHNPKLMSEVWMSKNALQSETVLVLINGMSNSEAPAWNMKACIYHGLVAGGISTYVSQARERGWGIVVCNPNKNGVVCETDCSDSQTGPAPPEIIQAISEFGFGEIAAHRGCLASKTTNLERCGNWICGHHTESDIMKELTECETKLRVLPIPYNGDPVAHVQYVWDSILEPSRAKTIHFVPFSYGGFAMSKLVEARTEKLSERLGKIGMADSSHFIDNFGSELSAEAVEILNTKARNWIPSPEPLGTELGSERLHVRSISAGALEHGCVAGLCASAILDFLGTE